MIVFITIVGVPLRWAIAIGIFTGASNVVPHMGFAAALLCGLAYALLAEDPYPLIPLVSAERNSDPCAAAALELLGPFPGARADPAWVGTEY